jgi:aspartate ammonia-lyase
VGTSITVPKYFVLEVVKNLQQICKLPLTRAENLSDATSNMDTLVEVHGILKAHAVNLEKMVNDLRLLSSDLHGESEVSIPKKQVGSSIMPGKVNPVIPEFIISSVHKIYTNDQLITQLSGQGCLELNAYLPVMGHALLESLKLLLACNKSCRENLISGLSIDSDKARKKVESSPSIATALLPFIGYNKATELALLMKKEKLDIYQANEKLKLVSEKKLNEILKPQNLVQGGYLLKDLED